MLNLACDWHFFDGGKEGLMIGIPPLRRVETAYLGTAHLAYEPADISLCF